MATLSSNAQSYIAGLETFFNNVKEKVLKVSDKKILNSKSDTEIASIKKFIFDEFQKREDTLSRLRNDVELKSAVQTESQFLSQLKEKFTKYLNDPVYYNYLMTDYLHPLFNRDFNKSREFKELLDKIPQGGFKK